MCIGIKGFVLSSGKEIKKTHVIAVESFTRIKNVEKNNVVITSSLALTVFNKQKRISEKYVKRDIDIFVLGTIIYKGMGRSDSYKILEKDIKRKGLNFIAEHIEGHFCVIIYEEKTGNISILTDHCGAINIYLYNTSEFFVISSSSISLSRVLPVTPDIDSIVQYLRLGYVTNSNTIYNEIKLLEPANIYLLGKNRELKKRIYWNPPNNVNEQLTFKEAKNKLQDEMAKIIKSVNKSNVIYDFTAGLDSRLILAILLSVENNRKSIDTFVFGPEKSREVLLVKKCAESIGVNNLHLTLPDDWTNMFFNYIKKALLVTDGEENILNYSLILWAQEEKSKYYEISSGGIGGSLFRDFWWLQEGAPRIQKANLKRLISSRIMQYEFNNNIYKKEWGEKFNLLKKNLLEKYSYIIKDIQEETYNTQQLDILNIRYKIRRWAGRTITSSQHVIDNVQPLIFKSCLESALMFKPDFKRNDKLVKSLIGDIAPDLKNQELMSGAPCLVLSPSNWHKFIPQIVHNGKRLLRKISQIMINRTILLDSSLNYNRNEWLKILLGKDEMKFLFNIDNMFTGDMYDKEKYAYFIDNAKNGSLKYYSQLGNMITLEMRMKEDYVKGMFEPISK